MGLMPRLYSAVDVALSGIAPPPLQCTVHFARPLMAALCRERPKTREKARPHSRRIVYSSANKKEWTAVVETVNPLIGHARHAAVHFTRILRTGVVASAIRLGNNLQRVE